MPSADHDFQSDLDAIARIDAVPTILDVVCRATGMGFAAVARVTESRWVACSVLDKIDFGLEPGGELKVETTICHEISQHSQAVIIDEVAKDLVYCGHPTPALYGFQSYISVPITLRNGRFFGTLCAIDPRPARLDNPETIGMFKLFAELIASHLDLDDQLVSTQSELTQERKLAELREQFVAVLGHDLRNPVAAIDAGAKMLLRSEINDKQRKILSLIQGSVLRMNRLIDNVLDLARARLGGGVMLEFTTKASLEPVLEQVISELVATFPDRVISKQLQLDEPVECDTARIGQLFSNLLGNALAHGDPRAPITTLARTAHGTFTLEVSNTGAPIAADLLAELFKPYFRGNNRSSQNGLGLGLYIASEIAHAHGGTLEVSSTPDETVFTLNMPCKR